MPAQQTCAECGAELTADAPQGLCPKCLLRRAIEETPTIAASSATPETPNVEPRTSNTEPPTVHSAIRNPQSAIGKVRYFGDYELLEEIARGGMGVVYKARQVSLNRVVAVKMILAGQLASDTEVKRFRTEAEAAANLQHPNIVAIHEIGEHEGRHYFSMDYVEGQSLAELARAKPLATVRAAELVKTIAEAVGYAHQRGILHRDLKPSNVLIDAHGQPRITDFGLAKRTEKDSGLTHSGAVLGTPSYMAPEQAAGKQDQVTQRSDLYALGAILYELLTGRPPFRAESATATLLAVLNDPVVPPAKLNPRVPQDLDTICLKCLEKEPGRRYETAGELAGELERFLNHEPVLARPASRVRKTWHWFQNHPWVITGMGTVFSLALICVSYGFWQQSKYAAWLANHPGSLGPVDFEILLLTSFIGNLSFISISLTLYLRFQQHLKAYRFHGTPVPRRFLGILAAWAVAVVAYGLALMLAGVRFRVWHPESFLPGLTTQVSMGFFGVSAFSVWFGAYALWLVLGLQESSKFSPAVERHLDWAQRIYHRIIGWSLTLKPATTGGRRAAIATGLFLLFLVVGFFIHERSLPVVNPLWRGSQASYRVFVSGGFAASIVMMAWFCWRCLKFSRRAVKPAEPTKPESAPSVQGRWLKIAGVLLLGFLVWRNALVCVARWDVVSYHDRLKPRLDKLEPNALTVLEVPDALNFAQAEVFRRVVDPRGKDSNLWLRIQGAVNRAAKANVFGSSYRDGKRLDLAGFIEPAGNGDPANLQSVRQAAAKVLDLLTPTQSEMDSLRQARQRPFAQIVTRKDSAIAALLEHPLNVRRADALAQLFCLRAVAHLHLGRIADALEDLLVVQKVGDATGSLYWLESALARLSLLDYFLQGVWEGLASRSWSDAELRTIQGALESANLVRDFDRHLRADHEVNNYFFEEWGLFFQSLPFMPEFFEDQLLIRKLFAEHALASYSVEPQLVRPGPIREYDAQLKNHPNKWGSFILGHVRLLEQPVMRVARSQSYWNLALLSCALERHRLAQQSYPEGLEQLSPSYVTRLPRDLIGGQPFQYRRVSTNRFALYSLGWNQADDGGVRGDRGHDLSGDWGWFAPNNDRR